MLDYQGPGLLNAELKEVYCILKLPIRKTNISVWSDLEKFALTFTF